MAGKLYIVPTPVGNLEDMTLRAIRVLKEADLVLAEDTRTSSVIFRHYDIHTRLQAHHKYNEHKTVSRVVEQLKEGSTIALISDAGTPGISDPGFLLSRECAAEGIAVETLPGATALIPAVVSSGLPCDRFCFEGFLPVKKGRQTMLQKLASEPRTMVFYESPYRLAKTLAQMCEYFGADRECSVAREISKVHEEHRRGTLAEVAEWFASNAPKGEIVLVVAGNPSGNATAYSIGDSSEVPDGSPDCANSEDSEDSCADYIRNPFEENNKITENEGNTDTPSLNVSKRRKLSDEGEDRRDYGKFKSKRRK